jgi:hypothetical protein
MRSLNPYNLLILSLVRLPAKQWEKQKEKALMDKIDSQIALILRKKNKEKNLLIKKKKLLNRRAKINGFESIIKRYSTLNSRNHYCFIETFCLLCAGAQGEHNLVLCRGGAEKIRHL